MSKETSKQRWHQSVLTSHVDLGRQAAQPVHRRLKLAIGPRVRQIAV